MGQLKRFEQDGKTLTTGRPLVVVYEQEHLVRITSYSDSEGPLQRTEEGLYLPVDDLRESTQGDSGRWPSAGFL